MKDEQLKKETYIHYQDEDGVIVTPLTMRASIAWGRGTRWCVSDKNEDRNTFDTYNTSGYLIFYITNERIYVPGTGKDHQVKFCGHRKELSLLDIGVAPVSYELPVSLQRLILKSDLLSFLMEHGNIHPYHFSAGTFNTEQINDMIRKGYNLSEFHTQDLSEENCITAIDHINAWQIKFAPPHLQTREAYISAARNDFQIIYNLDKNLPYFEEVRHAAFENYQEAEIDPRYKTMYKPWFEDLIAQKETGRTRQPVLSLVP